MLLARPVSFTRASEPGPAAPCSRDRCFAELWDQLSLGEYKEKFQVEPVSDSGLQGSSVSRAGSRRGAAHPPVHHPLRNKKQGTLLYYP